MDNKQKYETVGESESRFDIRKALVPLLMVVLGVLLIIAMVVFKGEKQDSRRVSDPIWGYFDTESVVINYSEDTDEDFRKNTALVVRELKKYHELFDIYHPHDGINGLYEINRNAGVGAVEVDAELIDFLEFCIEANELTDGEVNIAMGAVLSLWSEHRDGGAAPSKEALEAAARHTDISNIIIDRDSSTVYLADPEMSLDVGAVGKGYAVEKIAQLLIAEGAWGYALDIGGNIRIIGEKPSGAPFKTGIKDPTGRAENGNIEIIELKNTSAVTSGEYERGKHIIDKDTLESPSYFASVTVVTEHSGLADALSTALFCMDYESGRALAEALEDVEVVWVYNDGTVVKTE